MALEHDCLHLVQYVLLAEQLGILVMCKQKGIQEGISFLGQRLQVVAVQDDCLLCLFSQHWFHFGSTIVDHLESG